MMAEHNNTIRQNFFATEISCFNNQLSMFVVMIFCANDQYKKFEEIYKKHYDQAYPLKRPANRRKNERRDPKPWILPWLEDACARRQYLYHKKIKQPTVTNIAAYTKIDKFCDKQIDLAKKKYYKNFFDEHRDNSKKQWQLINGLLNRNESGQQSIRLYGMLNINQTKR